jgi:hypothetical protein
MLIRRLTMFIACCLLFAAPLSPVLAQEEDDPDQATVAPIAVETPISDTITEQAFFDRWTFTASAGDVILATMEAGGGLAPLLGLTDESGDLIARSDLAQDGAPLPNAEPNGTATLEVEIPQSGRYALVATRVGNMEGDTTGSYTLTLRRSDGSVGTSNTRQDVTFRCNEEIVTTVATAEFSAERGSTYRVTVYGLDGFQPVLRLDAEGPTGQITDCGSDTQGMAGHEVFFPGEEAFTLSEPIEAAAGIIVQGETSLFDTIEVTIGSIDGQPGRYLAVFEGFVLPTPDAQEGFDVRLGPLASETELLVYALRNPDSRINPVLTLLPPVDAPEIGERVCSDAGGRGCDDVPAVEGVGVIFSDGVEALGGRFDAGLVIAPGSTDEQDLVISSSARSANGGYAMLMIGRLPPRDE